MKTQENMIPPKGQNNFPVTDPKDMAIQDLPNKNFKKQLFQGNSRSYKKTQRQFSKIRETIHEQNEFNKEMKIIKKKNQTEILELKTTMNEIKTIIENINIRMHQAEERICELEYRNFEIIQSVKQGKKNKSK